MRNNAWVALALAIGIVGLAMILRLTFVTIQTDSDGASIEGTLFNIASANNLATITGDDSTNTITIAVTGSLPSLSEVNGVIIGEPNTRLRLSTDLPTATNNALIDLDYTTDEAKAVIAYRDKTEAPKIWLAGHDYLSFPLDRHQHFSVETTDSTGQLQSRLEIPYDADTSEIETRNANFTVGGTGTFTVAGGASTLNGNLSVQDGNVLIDNAGTATMRMDRGAITNFGSMVFATAGADKWSIQMRNDSTNNLYIRDNVTGTTLIVLDSNDNVIMPNLPTADPGVSGALWNNSGVINVSP